MTLPSTGAAAAPCSQSPLRTATPALREYQLDLIETAKWHGYSAERVGRAYRVCKDDKESATAFAETAQPIIERMREKLRFLALDYDQMYDDRSFSNNSAVNAAIDAKRPP